MYIIHKWNENFISFAGSETGSDTGSETGSETGNETGSETESETGSETGSSIKKHIIGIAGSLRSFVASVCGSAERCIHQVRIWVFH